MNDENMYRYWLFRVRGISSKKKIELVEIFKSANELYSVSENKLVQMGKLNAKQLKMIKNSKEDINLDDYSGLIKKDIKLVTYDMDDYPKRLREIHNPPYGLLYMGDLPHNDRKSVAIIGARMCSKYGEYLAQEFGSYLAKRGIQIISGLAKGIDGISQAAAINEGGSSFAILGCGVNICYPSENIHVYNELKVRGGIISEYDIDAPPLSQNFPARNRLISGMADAILVIEAKEKSGTLITVDFALEQGRDVYAIPGRIVDSLSYGCNYLIKQGAQIILSPKDLYRELCPYMEVKNNNDVIDNEDIQLEGLKKDILEVVDAMPMTVDEIWNVLLKSDDKYEGLILSDLMTNLMELTLDGYIAQRGGNFLLQNFTCMNRNYSV